jgi:hypothetical protein
VLVLVLRRALGMRRFVSVAMAMTVTSDPLGAERDATRTRSRTQDRLDRVESLRGRASRKVDSFHKQADRGPLVKCLIWKIGSAPSREPLRGGPYEKARPALGLVSDPVGGSHHGRAGSVTDRGAASRMPAHARTEQDDHGPAATREAVPIWRRRWDQAVPVVGTPGEAYLASRGIPIDTATGAGGGTSTARGTVPEMRMASGTSRGPAGEWPSRS